MLKLRFRAWLSGTSRPDAALVLVAATRTLVVGLTALYLTAFYHHPEGFSPVVDGVLDNVVTGAAVLVCLGRAVLVRAGRRSFLLFGLAAGAFTAGNLTNIVLHRLSDTVPYPSYADIGYLAAYPLLVGGVVLLARPELAGISRGALLDGAVGGLCCAAAGSILIVQPELKGLGGSSLTRIVGGAYPVLDLALLALLVGVITIIGGRPSALWFWLTAGIVAQVLADSLYLQRLANNGYVVGTVLDGLWAVGLSMIALAATCSNSSRIRGSERTAKPLILPNVFSVLAVATLIFGSLSEHRLPLYAVILTCAALGTAVKRTALGFSALRLLAFSQHQAQTDELTQLSNRRHFDQEAQRILIQRQPQDRVALVMIDLNAFKAVNDTYGHQTGDELLRQVAARLQRMLRPNDLLARLGGDEFGILLLNCDRETAAMIGQRLVDVITQPLIIEGTVHSPGASVGITICPDDGADLLGLMRQADTAMFDAKANRSGATLFDASRHVGDDESLNVREALDQHELVVHYQPQFDLHDGRMVGVEALVRWAHPARGLIAPNAFLPQFERAGLMAQLTLEVLSIALRDREVWQRAGTNLTLSVNIAPTALLGGDLTEPLLALLSRYRVPPGGLTMEITENSVIFDLERSRQALAGLRAMGVRLSLDDYGTGYCSLTYLRNLSLDEVKIDRSFVLELEPRTADAAIVTSTLWLARELGIRTVAEGVETVAALKVLRDAGCDIAQGYLLARPVPADQILLLPLPDWTALVAKDLLVNAFDARLGRAVG